MTRFISILVIVASILSLAVAKCQLQQVPADLYPKDGPRCYPQGEGDYTFLMDISASAVPSPDPSNPLAGYVSNHFFVIYDNNCTPLGAFINPPDNLDCGKPFIIEANFLDYVITIDIVNFDFGDPYYRFYYANGLYSIGNNHCDCHSVSDGFVRRKACVCAFPVHGEPDHDK